MSQDNDEYIANTLDEEGEDSMREMAYRQVSNSAMPVTREYAKQHQIEIPSVWKQTAKPGKTGKIKVNKTATPDAPTSTNITQNVSQHDFTPMNGGPLVDLTKAQLPTTDVLPGKQSLVHPNLLQPHPLFEQIPQTTGEGVEETHTRPSNNIYNKAQPLLSDVKDEQILRRHLPKQEEIDKLLDAIKKRVSD